MRTPIRDAPAVPAPETLELDAAPTPVLPGSESPPSSALALVLPLVGVGLLLIGASAVSAHRVPWPAVAGLLAAHRIDLVTAGVGAIALALLSLNVTVFL